MIKGVDVKLIKWNPEALKSAIGRTFAPKLNETAREGVSIAQQRTPVATGQLRSEMEVIEEATPSKLEVKWGNNRTPYVIPVEIGTRGRAGRYMIRQGFQESNSKLMNKLRGSLR